MENHSEEVNNSKLVTLNSLNNLWLFPIGFGGGSSYGGGYGGSSGGWKPASSGNLVDFGINYLKKDAFYS